jgi:hypothetical protein
MKKLSTTVRILNREAIAVATRGTLVSDHRRATAPCGASINLFDPFVFACRTEASMNSSECFTLLFEVVD